MGNILIVVSVSEIDHLAGIAQADRRKQFHFARFQRKDHFFHGAEGAAFALGARLGLGQVVNAQDHVLSGHGQRQAIGRRKNVAGREHQNRSLNLRLWRERNVHGHLVAVEIRVESGANQRMDADRFAFNQRGLEGLNAQAVQRGRAIQEHGMFANHFFQDVPYDGLLLLDHLLGLLNRSAMAGGFELVIDERLEELEGHLLGQAALIEPQFGSHDDDGAAGVVHALAEKVLAEAALLSLERVGKRFQGAIVGAAQDAAAAAVIE